MFLVYIGCTLGHIVHVREAQPGPEPSPPKGINLISSHNGFNNPKVLHLPHGSHGYKGVGGGHPTRKREAEPYPEPLSTHGTTYWGSRGGSAKPLHTLLASHGFHGFGGGHGVRKREADPNSAAVDTGQGVTRLREDLVVWMAEMEERSLLSRVHLRNWNNFCSMPFERVWICWSLL